ncbi:MAG: SMI1/KNR4 family protein [Sandaracinus sp.]|nr:SMI1/KNR4 family protein [Sandaracinus sp.]
MKPERLENPSGLFYSSTTHTLKAPMRESDRQALEARLGVTFPTSFLDVLRMRNGGYVRFGGVLGTVDGGEHDLYRFRSIAGIGDDHTLNIARQTKSSRDWDIPEWFVPFEGDGHWWLGFDYRAWETTDPPIVHIDSESLDVTTIATSFGDFLSRLVMGHEHIVLAVAERPADTLLRELGCSASMHPSPHVWGWRRFRSALETGQAASVTLGNNTHGPAEAWFLSRPPEQQLMHLDVALMQSDDAVDLVLEALDGSAEVIHCFPDGARKALER